MLNCTSKYVKLASREVFSLSNKGHYSRVARAGLLPQYKPRIYTIQKAAVTKRMLVHNSIEYELDTDTFLKVVEIR